MIKCPICNDDKSVKYRCDYKYEIIEDKKYFDNLDIHKCNNCDFSFAYPMPKISDLDFFYRMIVNFKLKGISTNKEEVLGEFSKGGFSSKVNYVKHLSDLNKIRINNNQNKIFVYLLYIFKIIKRPYKFFSSLISG